jgi:predicted nucleic acid-binding Zn ribbon protein
VESISRVLPALLRDLGLEAGVLGWRAVTEWAAAVGPRIARRTRAVSFRDGTLLIEVEGSSWRYELGFLKRDLLRQLNTHLGSQLVRDLEFTKARGGIRR